MGREQMRNLETFGVGDGQVNEFEYQKNQGELTEQLEQHPGEQEGAALKPPQQAERVKQIMAAAHRKLRSERGKASAGWSRRLRQRNLQEGAARNRLQKAGN